MPTLVISKSFDAEFSSTRLTFLFLEGGMRRELQHRLIWPYKVVIQEEHIEKGGNAADRPTPTDGTHNMKTQRMSYKLPTRQKADLMVPSATSTSMARATSEGLDDEYSVSATGVDDLHAEPYQEMRSHNEIVELAPISEARDTSQKRWHVPESALMTSDEVSF